MKSKVLIIGFFGLKDGQIDGQTIKTNQIKELLSENHNYKIDCFDTQGFSGFKSIVVLLTKIVSSNKIVYLPGKNNLKSLFLILTFICQLLRIRIIFIAVGGWLYDFVSTKEKYIIALNKCDVILVETSYLKDNLSRLGLLNVEMFPNFRISRTVNSIDLRNDDGVLRIVFMARIMEEKGIYTLIEFENWLLKNYGNLKNKFEIDFYGPISKNDEKQFLETIEHSEICNYKGVTSPNDVYEVLSKYDVLVLPTFYVGEGSPGSLIDAYFSGIPVIVSDWKQVPEFVQPGDTGFVFPLESPDVLFDKLIFLHRNSDELRRLKVNAINYSKNFNSTTANEILIKYI